MSDNKLATVIKESGLSQETKVKELVASFTGYFKKAQEIAKGARNIIVTDEKQTDLIQEARTKRLELKNVRIEVEKSRKELKEQSLREGKAIDGVANVIKALVVPVEEHLEKQEKYAEVKKAERLEKLHTERIEKLSRYVEDLSLYALKDMSNEAFSNLLDGSKRAFEAQKEAERKVEVERVAREKAEKEEAERIRKENEQLKKEAEEREVKEKKEREIQEAKVEAERKKREVAETKLKTEREEQENKERKAREKEEARVEADEEAKREALLAPDKDKLNKLAAEIDSFKFPAVESQEAGNVLSEARKQLTKTTAFLREKAKTL